MIIFQKISHFKFQPARQEISLLTLTVSPPLPCYVYCTHVEIGSVLSPSRDNKNVYIDSFSTEASPVHFMNTAASRKCTWEINIKKKNGLLKLLDMVIVILRNETLINKIIVFLLFQKGK